MLTRLDRVALVVAGFVVGMLAGINSAFPQDKQVIYGSDGVRIGTVEKEAPWSDKQVIRDANGNRVGTIEPQGFGSNKSVVRDNNGVTQDTIQPQDPFAPQQDEGN